MDPWPWHSTKKSKWYYIYFFGKIFQFFRNSNKNWKIERLGVILLKSPRVRTLKTINLSVYFFGQGINLIWEIQFHEFFEKLNFLRNICGYSISRIFWKIEFFEEDMWIFNFTNFCHDFWTKIDDFSILFWPTCFDGFFSRFT